MSIFISYRRDNGMKAAQDIFSGLDSEYDVFIDVIFRNGRFDLKVEEEARRCDDFILVVTSNLFDRCNEEKDWVRQEIKIALDKQKNIIPIFVETDNFPDNIPTEFRDIVHYNAIKWSNPSFFKVLKEFLCSCKKLKLQVFCKDGIVQLSDDSIQNLKEHFRHRAEFGVKEVDVSLSIVDMKEMILAHIYKYWSDVVKDMGIEAVYHSLRAGEFDRIEIIRRSMQTGIKFMLMDETLDGDSNLLWRRYVDRHGPSNCWFEDSMQSIRPLWTYFVWMDILNEMFQEFIVDVVSERGNQSRIWISTDVVLKNKLGNEVWHFKAFLRKDDPEDQKLVKKIYDFGLFSVLGPAYCLADYVDMGPVTRVDRIRPRMYYELGRLFNGGSRYPLDELLKVKNIGNLLCYQIGLS